MKFGITTNPTISFVRNQLNGFMYDREDRETYLIHDNSGELKWFDYESVGIKGIATVPYSPDMNAYAERFVGSIRREFLDYFVVFSRKQLIGLHMRAVSEAHDQHGIIKEIIITTYGRIRESATAFQMAPHRQVMAI